MIKAATNEISIFSDAEIKATINTIIIPLILTISTNNIAFGLCWILLLSIIYIFVHKQKVENAKMFFHFLKILIMIATGVFAVFGLLIV